MSAAGGIGGHPSQVSGIRRFGMNATATFATLVRRPRPDGPRPAWPARSRLVLGTLAAIVAVAAAMLLLDAWSTGTMRGLPGPMVSVFGIITDLGLSGWFLYPLAFLLVVIAAIDRPTVPPLDRGVLAALAVRFGFVFTAIAVPGLFVAIVKRLIGRARPFVVAQETWAYAPFGWRSDFASLPSGHATTAFAAALAIGAVWPRARLVMWIYAFVIALSRVIVTAHHPSDVIAGAIVGTIGALLVRNWFAVRRLGFAVGPDGAVHALPGPSWQRVKAVARRLVSA